MTSTSPNSATNINSTGTKNKVYHILAGKIFDSYERKLVANQVIAVDRDNGIILNVQDSINFLAEGEVIDLQHLTILPGFVDTHVHLFLHAYSEASSWTDQITKESLTERSLRAGVHARRTLMAGFTTVRDLGTEGAADADTALRKCLSDPGNGQRAIIPGPRYYCATRGIVCTGSYGPKNTLYPSKNGIDGIIGAEIADGVEECIRAVRRQVGAGADWIKIYGDNRVRSQISDVLPEIASMSFATFTRDELKAMIDTAHALGVKVAVHANTATVIERTLDLGADTVEHAGDLLDNSRGGDGTDVIEKWAGPNRNTTWVPTLAAFHTIASLDVPGAKEAWERAQRSFQKVLEINGTQDAVSGRNEIKIACGGDTGVFAHGENGLELALMRKLGAEWKAVLAWATLGGWMCVRGMEWEGDQGRKKIQAIEDGVSGQGKGRRALERNVPFGAIRKGWAGDLVGIEGEIDGDSAGFENAIMDGVKFVAKGGIIYKRDGKEVL